MFLSVMKFNAFVLYTPWFNAFSILRHDSEVLYFTVVDIIWSYFILLLEYINIYFQPFMLH